MGHRGTRPRDRVRLRHPRHRLRRVHGRGAASRGARGGGGGPGRPLPGGHARLRGCGHHPRLLHLLEARQPAARARLPALHARDAQGAGAGGVARAAADAAGGGVGAVRRLSRPAPLDRDPGLRGPLQAERPAHAVAHAPLSRAGRVQRRRRGHRHRHHRPGLGHRGDVRGRPPHPEHGARARALGLRLSADRLEPRLCRGRPGGRESSSHVRGPGFRAGVHRSRLGCFRRAPAAPHAEAVLRDPVRPPLQPVHDPARARGPGGGLPRRCDRVARLLHLHRAHGSPGHGDAGPLRPLGRARADVLGGGAEAGPSTRPRRRRPAWPRRRFGAAAASGLVVLASLGAIAGLRAGHGFDLAGAVLAILSPRRFGDWLSAAGLVVFAITGGMGTAATLVARRGVRSARS